VWPYARDIPAHHKKLTDLYTCGELKSSIDLGQSSSGGVFRGLESIYDAVDYLYSGRSAGKVVVDLWEERTTSKL